MGRNINRNCAGFNTSKFAEHAKIWKKVDTDSDSSDTDKITPQSNKKLPTGTLSNIRKENMEEYADINGVKHVRIGCDKAHAYDKYIFGSIDGLKSVYKSTMNNSR